MIPETAVAHVDMDCSYVSSERVRDECLRGLPVGVLGNQGAAVIARSYEMRAVGVSVAMPVWEAVKACPEGVFLKRDFRWYEVVSRAMIGVVRDLSPRVEYASIDEAACVAVPPRGRTFGDLAVLLRDQVWERVRVPVTVGVARTRTLAKFLVKAVKPFGAAAVLDPAGEAALLADRPITDLAGIAGRRARTLGPWGIRTCLDFARADRRLIRKLLTASGEALWWELNGEPVLPIRPERPLRKVLSRGGSFGEPTGDPIVLYAWLIRNLERLIEELHYHGLVAGRLTVCVGYRDGRAGQGSGNLLAPSDRFDILLDAARPCLRRAWLPRAAAQRMHLFAERLTPRGRAQLGLFDGPADRAESVARLKAAINDRHGRFALRSGATLPLASIYQDPASAFDICDASREKMIF
jgi:DNA polymerase V